MQVRSVDSIPRTFVRTSSRESILLSFVLPDGSPINPVAPPTRRIGLMPKRLNRTIVRIEIKFPRCNESAVGSNPAYALIGFVDVVVFVARETKSSLLKISFVL